MPTSPPRSRSRSQVLQHARDRFTDVVMRPTWRHPGRAAPAGVLRALDRVAVRPASTAAASSSTPQASSTTRRAPVRDELVRAERDKLESVVPSSSARLSARATSATDVDAEQFAYELEGIVLAHHHARRLMRDDQGEERARAAPSSASLDDCRAAARPA